MSGCTIGYLMFLVPTGLLVLFWLGYLLRVAYQSGGWKAVLGLLGAFVVFLSVVVYGTLAIKLVQGCN